jgi:hypothetical protein
MGNVGRTTSSAVVVDSIVAHTVVPDTTPSVKDSVIVRYKYVTIPVNDTIYTKVEQPEIGVAVEGDSVQLEIPISQKVYETDDYRAYVSGYDAKLDSVFISQKVTTVHIRDPAKAKRFSVGLQAGYGMTPKGFQPYVGVGVSINLWSR